MAAAMSSGLPTRPTGYQRASLSKSCGSRSSRRVQDGFSVRTEPGLTVLARMPLGPYSTAMLWLRLSRPALAAL